MNRLLSYLCLYLSNNRSHCSHPIFTSFLLLFPYVIRFQHLCFLQLKECLSRFANSCWVEEGSKAYYMSVLF